MTKLQIANWALDLMSSTEIQALTENNKAARALTRQMQLSLDTVVEKVKPEVCKETTTLSNDGSAPAHPHFSQQAEIPGDYITALNVWNGDPYSVSTKPIPEEYWDIEGTLLLHSLTYPVLEYIKQAGDSQIARFRPSLAEAVAHHLAAATARKITGSDGVSEALMKAYLTNALPEAQMQEGKVKVSRKNREILQRHKRSPLAQSRWSPRLTQ